MGVSAGYNSTGGGVGLKEKEKASFRLTLSTTSVCLLFVEKENARSEV